jgi:hypothetical protein
VILAKRYRMAFYHTPKTGGSSVTAALEDCWSTTRRLPVGARGWQVHLHHGYMHAHPAQMPAPDGYRTACFVRNPYSLMLSLYGIAGRPEEPLEQFCVRFLRAPATVQTREGTRLALYSDHRQAEFARGCQFVGRFERLEQDFASLCEWIGIAPRRLPHENRKTGSTVDLSAYTDAARAAVAEAWAEDLAELGYGWPD